MQCLQVRMRNIIKEILGERSLCLDSRPVLTHFEANTATTETL